jgi:hypothetical protein
MYMELLALTLALAAVGALAIRYGADTRASDPSPFHKI